MPVGLSVTPGKNRRSSTTADKAAAGLDGPRALPKGLRHGFGGSADIPLNLVQKWLGHAQLSTRVIYADAVGEEKRGFSVPSSLSDLRFRRNYQTKTGPRLDYYYNATRRNEAKCQNFPIFP